MHVKVRYNPLFGILTLALSGSSLLIQLFLTLDPIQLLSSLFLISVGLLLLVSSYFEVAEDALHLKLVAGLTVKSFPIPRIADLEAAEGKLFILRGREREQIRGITRLLAHPRDWRHLCAILETARQVT
ncbi:MAG: hypothetical protein H6728_14965 [Myxococcales bacterium]|nr:hypothetical protein [Myxococcales bacterium]MCB9644371.1 hypothetical protein [Myxococcales bacterium]